MLGYSTATPFEILLDYERKAQAHAVGSTEQVESEGLWRGIGFRVNEHHLLSALPEVNEILSPPPITIVPGAKFWLLGVANIRGNLVAVIDLQGFLEGKHTALTEKSRILVVRQGNGMVGLLVDEVLGQRNFTQENVPLTSDYPDERYKSFIAKHFNLSGAIWGIFSMASLVKSPEFSQTALD